MLKLNIVHNVLQMIAIKLDAAITKYREHLFQASLQIDLTYKLKIIFDFNDYNCRIM